jgi:CheY-like chemotaxis protein
MAIVALREALNGYGALPDVDPVRLRDIPYVGSCHPGQSMSRKSVFIVDDDLDIREILAETLVEKGFDVTTAANGDEALRVLRTMSVRPSVILLDLMMPIMDGYQFLEQRCLDPTIACIPVAIVTAGHGVDRARLGDGLEIIRKPFDVPRLVGILHTLGSIGNHST